MARYGSHARPSPSTVSSPASSAVEASIVSGDLRQLVAVRKEPRMLRDFQVKSARMANPGDAVQVHGGDPLRV